jgi:hypothetical protein
MESRDVNRKNQVSIDSPAQQVFFFPCGSISSYQDSIEFPEDDHSDSFFIQNSIENCEKSLGPGDFITFDQVSIEKLKIEGLLSPLEFTASFENCRKFVDVGTNFDSYKEVLEHVLKELNEKNKIVVILTDEVKKLEMDLSEMENSKNEMEKSKNEMEKSKNEMEKSKNEMEKSKNEIEKSKIEIEKSKNEMEKSKNEMEKSKIEIEKSKDEIEKVLKTSKNEIERLKEKLKMHELEMFKIKNCIEELADDDGSSKTCRGGADGLLAKLELIRKKLKGEKFISPVKPELKKKLMIMEKKVFDLEDEIKTERPKSSLHPSFDNCERITYKEVLRDLKEITSRASKALKNSSLNRRASNVQGYPRSSLDRTSCEKAFKSSNRY